MNDLLEFIEMARAGVKENVGPRTATREKRRELYRRYYHATGQTRKDQARQARYQAESRETARRHGEQWDANDLATALRLRQPLMVSAHDAQRTYAAIRQGRYRLIRKAGFRNTLLKGEEQEFDALARNEDATAEDWIALDQKWREVFTKTIGGAPSRDQQLWGAWEIEMLKDSTISDAQMAEKLGRTARAVSARRRRMKAGQEFSSSWWWSEEDEALARDASASPQEVAWRTGRSVDAVYKKRRRLKSARR